MENLDKFRFKWWALIGVCILAFTAFMDATIVNTALPFIQTALNISILQLQWVANIFTIVLSMSAIALGKIADLFGKKKVFYCGVVGFAIAAVGAGLSNSVSSLVFFRGIQALGASTILVASTSLLSIVFPEKERVRAISIYAGVTGFGLMIGPFIGGILVGLLGWRWVFWINLPLIAIGLMAASFSLRGHTHEKPSVKMDWIGLSLLILGLGSFLYGIIEGAHSGWAPLSWLCIGGGLTALIFLIVLDEKKANPLLDLHIFKNKLILLSVLSCVLAGVSSTVFMFFDPLYLRILRQLSPFLIGLLIAVIPAAQVLISLSFHSLEKKLGVANLLFLSSIAAFLAILLHRFLYANSPLFFLIFPFFLLGINWGMSNAASIAAANQVISPKKIGSTLGTIMTLWNISGSTLLAISTAIFHAISSHSSFLTAFHCMVYFNLAVAAVTVLCALWAKRAA